MYKNCIVLLIAYVAFAASIEEKSALTEIKVEPFLEIISKLPGQRDLTSAYCTPCGKNIINKCYHVVCYMQANWYGAIDHCNSLGMRLAVVENDDQNRELAVRVSKSECSKSILWIGGSNVGDGKDYIWVPTGRSLVYQKLLANCDCKDECCVEYKGGHWWGNNCKLRRNFVCEAILDNNC